MFHRKRQPKTIKVHIHYREFPDLDIVADAKRVAAEDDPNPCKGSGCVYAWSDHFGFHLGGDQHGPGSEYTVWWEEVNE